MVKNFLKLAVMGLVCVCMSSCADDELEVVNDRFEKLRIAEAEETKGKSAVPEGDERRPGESTEDWMRRLKWKLRNDILNCDK